MSGTSKRVAMKVVVVAEMVVMAATIAKEMKGLRHLLERTPVSRFRNRKVLKMAREKAVAIGKSYDKWHQ